MKILMLAPECVAGPYGTPRCVAGRIHGLLKLGHDVTLVTYPYGQTLQAPGLRVIRVPRVPFTGKIPVGPSFGKLLHDLPLMRTAKRLLREEKYDLLHTHEEAAYLGVFAARRQGIPHLYDMHSSLPEGLENYGWRIGPLRPLARAVEAWVLRRVDRVLAICPALKELVERTAPQTPVVVVENVPFDMLTGNDDLPFTISTKPIGRPLYCGGFDKNQGIDLLLQALACDRGLPVVDVFGGQPEQVHKARAQAQHLRIEDRVQFHGIVPFDRAWDTSLHSRALLSPRVRGSNVPSKVYHYLRAGRPIVATDLAGHRQVLDESCAEMVPVQPQAFAQGIRKVLEDGQHADRLALNARLRYEDRYTFTQYLKGLGLAISC